MKRFLLMLCLPAASALGQGTASTPVAEAKTPVSSLEAEIPYFSRSSMNPEGTAFVPPSQAKDGTAQSIVYNQGNRWPNPKAIPQCWVNPEEGGDIVADLQNVLTQEYAKAGMGFVWEGKCEGADFNRVMIRTWFKRTHVWNTSGGISGGGGLSFLGAINANLGGSEGPQATMNVQVARDVVGYPNTSMRSWVINVTRATTVHEFGHALGLAHEQERNDAPVCNDIRGTLNNGGAYVFVGAYDRYSIMNYCKDPANVSSLSAGDLEGLKYLYPPATVTPPPPPPPTTGQPKGSYVLRVQANNKCIDVANNSKENGALLQAWDCNGTTAQSFWLVGVGGGYYQLRNTNSGKCIDVLNWDKRDGARLGMYNCTQGTNQRFSMIGRGNGYWQLKLQDSGKCFDVDLASGRLQQWACNAAGQANQNFGFQTIGASKVETGAIHPSRPN